jgi:hypothetical protein
MADATSVPVVPQVPPTPAADASRDDLWRKVLRVAWLSILLGLLLEVLLLGLALFSNTLGESPKPFLSDLVQKVSWSFIVCLGLAFGTAASAARRPGTMGLFGLISAPLGFTIARTLHKGVNEALGVASTGGAFPVLILIVKSLEYGLLGAALGWLTKRSRTGTAPLSLHIGTGAAIGLTFGVAIVALLARTSAAPQTLVDLTAKGINEVLFPIGCSVVLYAAEVMGKRLGS